MENVQNNNRGMNGGGSETVFMTPDQFIDYLLQTIKEQGKQLDDQKAHELQRETLAKTVTIAKAEGRVYKEAYERLQQNAAAVEEQESMEQLPQLQEQQSDTNQGEESFKADVEEATFFLAETEGVQYPQVPLGIRPTMANCIQWNIRAS
ncbi:unnamed protein product [Orchesella dallaii]|uniref:Uncharacterized protein n=1 Tax=Orchesella dallaii TaxID=48710 RepID=A0ABP1RN32_9HEXA